MRTSKTRRFRDPCELCWREEALTSIAGVVVGQACYRRTMAIKREADRDQLARIRATRPRATRRLVR